MTAIGSQLDGVKGRQQKMWASGDYAAVAARIHPMAERLCESADLVAGTRVLDVATGSGNAAIAAARVRCRRHRLRAVAARTRPGASARRGP
jgi:predicted nicotinamide N-methyase